MLNSVLPHFRLIASRLDSPVRAPPSGRIPTRAGILPCWPPVDGRWPGPLAQAPRQLPVRSPLCALVNPETFSDAVNVGYELTSVRAAAFPPLSCGHDVGFVSSYPHHDGGRPVTGFTNKARRIERRRVRESRGFGRHLAWMPEGFPEAAVDSWPRKDDWPRSTDILRFIEDTRGRLDARLAVLTGLRRWAEPASSQLLITGAAIIVSIVAVILTVSAVGLLLRIGMVGAGLTYIVV